MPTLSTEDKMLIQYEEKFPNSKKGSYLFIADIKGSWTVTFRAEQYSEKELKELYDKFNELNTKKELNFNGIEKLVKKLLEENKLQS